MLKVAILGSTGSIGTQALNFIATHPDEFKVVSLAAGNNLDLLSQQIVRFKPQYASLHNQATALKLADNFDNLAVGFGEDGLLKAVEQDVDLVLMAVSGMSALAPTIRAIQLKKDLALANKEVLVAAGDLVMQQVRQQNISLIPVDSEHSAVMQIIYPHKISGFIEYQTKNIQQIVLTASGGAFRDERPEDLATKTPTDALKHPTWSMGKKITIDSATMMNKGLEIIEAQKLFGLELEQIKVLIHRQSLVHAMVEYQDGTVLAQLGPADMRLPIGYALSYGQRKSRKTNFLEIVSQNNLSFTMPDPKKYPALELAYQAARLSGTYPTVLNAANEIAVNLFLQNKIKFTQITEYVRRALQQHHSCNQPGIEQIMEADRKTRQLVLEYLNI